MRTRLVIGILAAFAPSPVLAQGAATTVDFVQLILSLPDSGRSIGFHKLTAAEREALGRMLNSVMRAGRDAGAPTPSVPPTATTPGRAAPSGASASVYVTRVETDGSSVIKLENGAVVEPTGYVGYLGFRKRTALIVTGRNCRIWFEGKRTYRCSIVTLPSAARARSAVETFISEVVGNGSIIKLADGSLWEIDGAYTYATAIWLVSSPVLLIDEIEMLNLDAGDELIPVRRLK